MVIIIGSNKAGAIPRSPTIKLINENPIIMVTFSRGKTGVIRKENFVMRTTELTSSALEIASAQELKIPSAPNPTKKSGSAILPIETSEFFRKIYLPVRKARKILSVKKSIVIAIVNSNKIQPAVPSRRNNK